MQARRLAVLMIALGACGGGQSAPPEPPVVSNTQPAPPPPPPDAPPPTQAERARAAMQAFAEDMCACTDAECARRVSEEMSRWGEQLAKEQDEVETLNEEQQKQFVELGTRMGECMARAMGAPPASP